MFLEVSDVSALMTGAGTAVDSPTARCLGLAVRGETAAGENYGSTFLMADAHYQDGDKGVFTVPVVCKRLPPTEYLQKTFNVDVSFPKEVNFYRVVAPAMTELQRELRIPDAERITAFPKLYGARIGGGADPAVVDGDAIMVLEDLAVAGYRCGDRNRGLDLEHCKLAVRELARFHALGLALRRLRPAVFGAPAFQDACAFFMHNRADEHAVASENFCNACVDLVLAEIPEIVDVVDAARLRRAAVRPRDPAAHVIREPFACVVHTDFWVNNMMFAYDEHGRPDRLKMVDFQLTEVGSPASDLVFFVYSSADAAALAHVDGLLREYHAELLRYARLHGLDVADMHWEAFERELAAAATLEFSHLLFMTSIIRAQNKIEKADTNSDEAFTKDLGVSESARERYLDIARHFASRGWIKP